MMPLTRDEFLKRALDCGLVTGDVVAEINSRAPADAPPLDGEQLARELVRLKKLTKFQAEQICAGRGNSLTLGNYVILDKLGQGGMGMVLKAEHKRMKRLVAIKVMSPTAVKTSDALKRFHREVEAAAKLRHPNIVAADDADEANGTHFLVMEYVEGSDLSVLVKKHGPLSVGQAVRCIIQAARGLEFAHEQGVIHRDIKPANLLIDAKGTVKILDMGLARIDGAVGGSSEGAGLTNTGTIMGTVDYMSPEQAMDTKHADARSDIYSLGISLYYLLTGKVAYDGDTMMKKLMAHQHAPIPSLSSPHAPQEESRTSLDPRSDKTSSGIDGSPAIVSRSETATLTALDTVFRRMVAKRSEDRPQTMTQVIAELECCLSGGSPTIALERSAANATTSGPIVGSGNERHQFLQPISGGDGSTATSASPAGAKGTAVVPSSADGETMISTADEAHTDPQTQTMLATEARSRTTRQRVIAIGLLACVVLAGIIIKLTIKDGTTPEATVPDGTKKVEITGSEISNSKSQIADSKGWHGWPVDAPAPAIAPFNAEQAKKHQEAWAKHLGVPVEYTNSIGMKFVLIPPGEFLMGSTPAEIEETLQKADDNKHWQRCLMSEAPQHKVVLTQPIYLSVHEVSQKDYEAVMGVNPSHFRATGLGKEAVVGLNTATHPVELVSWSDAAEFCTKLSQQEKLKPFYVRVGETVTPLDGTGYGLPTEAEWEFACRAGTTTKCWIGDQDEDLTPAGWFYGNSGGRTHAAGELKGNPFGLYDIHGNVWEWVQDTWEPIYYGEFQVKPALDPKGPSSAGSYRVLRGGEWSHGPARGRAAGRHAGDPTYRGSSVGFRVSLTIDAVKAALASKPVPAKAPFDAKQARAHQEAWARHLGTTVETTNSVGAKMILIPPGEFLMGAPDDDDDAQSQEKPQHKVRLTKPFHIGATEVTVGQFRKFVEATKYVTQAESDGLGAFAVDPKERRAQLIWNKSGPEVTDEHPVRFVSWEDARQFCEWLGRTESLTYRLPTDAEWEYACRAGTTTRYSFGNSFDEAQVNASKTSRAPPLMPSGRFPANPFGLFDMHGNVNEICWDGGREFSQDESVDPVGSLDARQPAVVRGGAISSYPARLRSSQRYINDSRVFPEVNFATTVKGFRVVAVEGKAKGL